MTDDLIHIPRETHCSVHDRCIWELALEGAKRNAETAIRRMENAEIRLAAAEELLEKAEEYLERMDEEYASIPMDIDMTCLKSIRSDLAKYRGEK